MSNHKNDNMSEIVYILINTTSWLPTDALYKPTTFPLVHECSQIVYSVQPFTSAR